MANFQSPQVTNRVAAPFVPNAAPFSSATANHIWVVAHFVVPTGLATSDTYELVRLPTTCRLLGMYAKNESGLGTTVTFDVGLYRPSNVVASATAMGAPTLISQTALATGVAGATTRAIMTPILTGPSVANSVKTLWEVASATAEPQLAVGPEYVVTLTMTTVSTPTVGNVMAFLFLVQTP